MATKTYTACVQPRTLPGLCRTECRYQTSQLHTILDHGHADLRLESSGARGAQGRPRIRGAARAAHPAAAADPRACARDAGGLGRPVAAHVRRAPGVWFSV